jgi:zinc protease
MAMKRALITCAVAIAAVAPAPASARQGRVPGADTATASFEIAGIRVIHRRVSANEIVAANLYLLGGSRQITFANAGIEPLLLTASERGTARFSREALRQRLARTGSSIGVSAERDWTVFALRTTLAGFAETWPAFADRVVAPRLDAADVATVREQTLAALAQRKDSPDEWAEHLADSVAFAGHPYGVDPVGTEKSVASLTADGLRAYHRAHFTKSRLLLVVVGDVQRRTLDSLVNTTLGTLPAGDYRWTIPDTAPRRPTVGHREARALPTNYLIGYAPGPRADSPDFNALRIACAVLSGRLFAEVRSRQALTYAVSAPFVERAIGGVGLYVSTTDPVAALAAMRAEVNGLQQNSIDTESLTPLIQQFITEYFLDNETNAAQASFLARAELYQGNWRRGAALTNDLRAVTAADVRRVMQAYFRDINFAYVGNPAALPESAFRAWR